MVVVVGEAVVVVADEDEGSRIARSTGLIFGILFRMGLICDYPLKATSNFQAQVGVSFSITSTSWYTDCDFIVCECIHSFFCILKSNEISLRSLLLHIPSSYEEDGKISRYQTCIPSGTIIVHDF